MDFSSKIISIGELPYIIFLFLLTLFQLYILMTKVKYTCLPVPSLNTGTKHVCIFVLYICQLCLLDLSISLLIIHGCSTCRDACQLCKDTSHLPCFCKYILSHFLWMAVCLSHTHAHTCSAALYIVGPNLPGSYRLISEALCQSVV